MPRLLRLYARTLALLSEIYRAEASVEASLEYILIIVVTIPGEDLC